MLTCDFPHCIKWGDTFIVLELGKGQEESTALMAHALWESSSQEEWADHLGAYVERVALLDERRSGLNDLDTWFFKELTPAVRSREPAHVTKDELVKLVQWKLKREKFRPRLLGYAQSQDEALVVDVTSKGFGILKQTGAKKVGAEVVEDEKVKDGSSSGFEDEDGENKDEMLESIVESLECLTELKGVGPATASGLLAALNDGCPFMSYEAMDAVLGKGKDGFTVIAYRKLAKMLRGKAADLSSDGNVWTAVQVEQALYSYRALELVTQKEKRKSSEVQRGRKKKKT